jgi:parallel beta-helix repeat protein
MLTGCHAKAVAGAAVFGLLALAAAPASAQPVRCGDTVKVDTKLQADLVDCPGDGLVIGAAGVKVDLNGHTIDGDGRDEPGGAGDDGVANTAGFDRVTVEGGRIKEFEAGVRLGDFGGAPNGDARRNVVRGLRVFDSDAGVLVVDSDQNRIERNRVDNVTGGAGVRLANGAAGNVVRLNSLTRGGAGVEVGGVRNRVERNRAFANCVGISLPLDSDQNVVHANRSVRNNCIGIELIAADGNRLVGNRVRRNVEAGINLIASTQNALVGNRVSRTLGNDFTPDPDGIHLDDTSVDNRLLRNLARRNRDDGIDLDGAPNKLTRNGARHNRDLGIDAAEGTVDGGGNRAAGNGGPAQCKGVACS